MRIELMRKADAESVLPRLYRILHANMSLIAPTGKSYEEDLSEWLSCVKPALQKEPRQILLLREGDELIGFFQYYVNGGVFMMEEIQICAPYQGRGVFGGLYAYLTGIIPKDTEFAEAYANKSNHKSMEILAYLGLEMIGENQSGNAYHFRGRYENILRRYGEK